VRITVINGYFSHVGRNRKSCRVFSFPFSSSSLVLYLFSGLELGQRRWLWQRGQWTGTEGLRLSPLLHNQYAPDSLLDFSPCCCCLFNASSFKQEQLVCTYSCSKNVGLNQLKYAAFWAELIMLCHCKLI